MKGDFTRRTFKQTKHYSSVRMQQGRVQLDADWNEQADIRAYLEQTSTRDLIGAAGGPQEDAGFALSFVGGELRISAGRYYVDGLLCENEAEVSLEKQPDLPGQTLPTNPGTYLAYIDVWQQHVTALEDPDLREVALGGPDTATRLKTVWQMKVASLAADTHCPTAFLEQLFPASSGKLSARAQPQTTGSNPCIVPASAGFRGLENQLYRVEIHGAGVLPAANPNDAATFKWSRENGSVVTTWLTQNGNDLAVQGSGRDAVLSFKAGDWVELTDDNHELSGIPGTLVKLTKAEGDILTIDPTTASSSLLLADFPMHPKVRRWDIPESISGALTVEVPAGNGGFIALENGVEVKFEPGTYQVGDFWLIPARTVLGDLFKSFNEQPSEGIRHHYAKLGVLIFDGTNWTVEDCRDLFPPLTKLLTLHYVGGDGQEALPGQALLHPLEVRVSRGAAPMSNMPIRFTVLSGGGSLSSILASTDAAGFAATQWKLGTNGLQRVEAVLLDAAQQPMPGQTVHFNANFSRAREQGDEAGFQIKDVTIARENPLLNDQTYPIGLLTEGIQIICTENLDQVSVQDKPVCRVTLELPYPITPEEQNLWDFSSLIGYRPLILATLLNSDNNTIFWSPAPTTLDWLDSRTSILFDRMQEFELGERILAHLTVKGNVIWASDDKDRYLDGDAFGVEENGLTRLRLPSGDRRQGGEFALWFWLTR